MQGPRSITPAEKTTQHVVLGVFFVYRRKIALGLRQLSDCNTLAVVPTALPQTVTCHCNTLAVVPTALPQTVTCHCNTLAVVPTALPQTVTCHFITKNIYYKSPKIKEHPIFLRTTPDAKKVVSPARSHRLHRSNQIPPFVMK
jgi:hypothetical protein